MMVPKQFPDDLVEFTHRLYVAFSAGFRNARH